ncbi:ATP-dependent 6-phosphofructokinase [Desulfonema magnum]|uniref:ATP-dependent 6-phosphofructokinase n=1 Tax=Desulfonema magnum TaxID=45655 RepID=A0A975GSY3_9BACT|nr:ATP-dependent 6-phosphofructokinase [Desulfonema magnum]QTA91558.1 ATP-dependent 6-phosphofructokinase [Desulfonema magnum]
MDYESIDTIIPTLGKAGISTPIQRWEKNSHSRNFVSDTARVLIDVSLTSVTKTFKEEKEPPSFEIAGPREKIYFDPSKLRCALVTCGGLCPGLNGIIRSIVLELYYGYGVRNIYGIQYGLQGFIPKYGHDIVDIKPEAVANIIKKGGSFLGSSRGPQDVGEIVDCLERMNIGALFMIGGDGTLMAATKIADAITERGLKISVVGIPKTIDNDIHLVSRSFGFDTAVEVATNAIRAAHNEAQGYPNGIGLIKLMGRHSGFIASTAALAQQDVNFVLIPEVEFDLEGPGGFLDTLEKRLKLRGHAVIVVAEGAGQKLFEARGEEYDASGNVKLNDIGLFLKDAAISYFEEKNIKISLKYIDPSYIIRSLPANANDHVFCSFLGRDAVHAAMAGKTKLLIGHWNNHFVHIPMTASAGKRKQVDPHGKLWSSVLDSTGQGSLKNG